jgi:hypothetical protein
LSAPILQEAKEYLCRNLTDRSATDKKLSNRSQSMSVAKILRDNLRLTNLQPCREDYADA